MKTLLLTLISVLALNSYAQLTYVPDDAFESFLENTFGASDGTPNNDYVLTSALQGPGAGYFNLLGSAYFVTDLTGIEDFGDLVHIVIDGIGATVIDLSSITSDINLLKISNNGPLQELKLPNANIGGMFILNNSLLVVLEFNSNSATSSSPGGWSITGNNSIEEIDMSMAIINQPKTLQLSGNTMLNCLNIANGGCVLWSLVMLQLNPSLYNVIVDNPNYSNLSSTWFWNEQMAYFGTPPNPYQYVTGNCSTVVLLESLIGGEKELIKIVDLMGRETEYKPNTVLIYGFDDGRLRRCLKWNRIQLNN